MTMIIEEELELSVQSCIEDQGVDNLEEGW